MAARGGRSRRCAGGAACITVVADRESDIYEPFARRPTGVPLLTRTAQDRSLADGERLSARMEAWPKWHRETIVLPAPPSLACPFARPPQARSVPDAALYPRVIAPPGDGEPQADGERGYFCCRCEIDPLAGVAALIAAMQIVIGRNGKSEQMLADAMDLAYELALMALNGKLEGRTEKLKNPHPPGCLAWISWSVARLGGWSGYTSRGYEPAGPKTIARSLVRLDGIIEDWALHSADVRLR